ncbi:MAG: tyrosine-type recombinase/integrase [Saprospiraceae bacterium]|nr:tyrosine-type recombinase/integrase [Saprospiraceae bacterium]MBL0026052.1 tyrosine-type recombinase/integrase [Saprospiraceae bacterium]
MKTLELILAFIDHLRIEKKYSVHTCDSYKNDLLQLNSFMDNEFDIHFVSDIKHRFIRSWIVNMMSQKISATSVNRKISAVRSFYKWLLKRDHIDRNPMIKIVAPKKPKKLPVIVQDANISRLLEKNAVSEDIIDSYEDSRNTFIVELLYSTGIRRSELIGLNISDINMERDEIRVKGKGNKIRSIPLTESLKISINDYLKARNLTDIEDNNALILTGKGLRIYPRLVHKIVVSKLGCITTLSKKSPHVLRHSFATHMLDRGAELNAIKELLGHSNLAATQVYTHNSISKLKETYLKSHPRIIK